MSPEFLGFLRYDNGVMIFYKGRMASDGIGHEANCTYYSESDLRRYAETHQTIPPEISMAMALIQEQKRV